MVMCGFEFELVGVINDCWNVLGGYIYCEFEDCDGNLFYVDQFKYMLKLVMDYCVLNFLDDKLIIGGVLCW